MLATPALDAFFDTFATSNPFESNRVVPAQETWLDAAEVFAAPFAAIVERIERVHGSRLAQGILLWGEAGIGKSHLLERLERWLREEPPTALFLSLANLQAEPERVPRALLRSVMGLLTAGRVRHWRGTPLFRVMNGMVRYALGGERTGPYAPADVERAYRRLLDGLCRESPARAALIDRTVFNVFLRFFLATSEGKFTGNEDVATLAVRWLRGDLLDEEDAHRLDVPLHPEGSGLADDEQVKKVLVALTHIAYYWDRPMVLVLDQVDNLEPAQFRALARFLHALLDASTNLVVLCAGVRASLLQWRHDKVIQDSSWDRLAQVEMELQRLPSPAARPLIAVRLERFFAPFDEVDELRAKRRQDPLFPLGTAWFDRFCQDRSEVRPRDVLSFARKGWQEQQAALRAQGRFAWLVNWRGEPGVGFEDDRSEAEIVEQTVRRRLDELVEIEKERLQTCGWDPDGVADLLKNLGEVCRAGDRWPHLKDVKRIALHGQQRPTLHLVLEQRVSPRGPDLRRGVACLLDSRGNPLTFQLERLLNLEESPDELILIREDREPFAPGARGREHLEALEREYGDKLHRVALRHEEHAWLRALVSLLGETNSPEFETDLPGGRSRRIRRDETLEVLFRADAFFASPLLRLLLKMEAAVEHAATLANDL